MPAEFVIDFITDIVPYGGVIILVFCFAVAQMIKSALCEKLPNKYIPLIAGIVGGLVVLVLPTSFSGEPLGARIIYGILCGWASTGAYETIRNILGSNKE